MLQMQLNDARNHSNSASSISISGPIVVSSSGGVLGGPPTVHLKSNIPTSHKTMPPPPPPTNVATGTNSMASTSTISLNGRSEQEMGNVPLTHRFSKTRFQFSRKVRFLI